MGSCAQAIYPPNEDYADFEVEGMNAIVRVEPFVNAMPGSNSSDVIIPISFLVDSEDEALPWPRKFRITKIRISGVKKRYTRLSCLDHNNWIHNTLEEEDRNVLRVPDDEIGTSFDIRIWFKDDAGKLYRVEFRGAYAGKVQ